MNCVLRNFFSREEGQGLVEYALILVLIAIVVIGMLTLLGDKVSEAFSTIRLRARGMSTSSHTTP